MPISAARGAGMLRVAAEYRRQRDRPPATSVSPVCDSTNGRRSRGNVSSIPATDMCARSTMID